MLHGTHRVGQVGLQHDAGFESQQFWAVEQPGEHLDGHVEVPVLLHIQVDELLARVRCRVLVERQELVNYVVHRLRVGPRRMRRHGGRDLDGHVVHIVSLQECACAGEAFGRLAGSEHGLAQQVHVEFAAGLFQVGNGRAKFGIRGVHNQVAHEFAQDTLGGGHHQARGNLGCGGT